MDFILFLLFVLFGNTDKLSFFIRKHWQAVILLVLQTLSSSDPMRSPSSPTSSPTTIIFQKWRRLQWRGKESGRFVSRSVCQWFSKRWDGHPPMFKCDFPVSWSVYHFKVLDNVLESDKMVDKYETLVSDLLSWIEETIIILNDRTFANSLAGERLVDVAGSDDKRCSQFLIHKFPIIECLVHQIFWNFYLNFLQLTNFCKSDFFTF